MAGGTANSHIPRVADAFREAAECAPGRASGAAAGRPVLAWGGLWRIGLLAALLSTLGACGSSVPSGFPPYPPADEFLAYQEQLNRPRPPPQYEYNTALQNLNAFERTQANAELYRSSLALRKERETLANLRAQGENRALWDSLQEKWNLRAMEKQQDAVIMEMNRNEGRVRDQAAYDHYRAKVNYLEEKQRLNEAPRDAEHVLELALTWPKSRVEQEGVINSLIFKLDCLWAQQDALYEAYVEGHIPPGAFVPEDFDDRPRFD